MRFARRWYSTPVKTYAYVLLKQNRYSFFLHYAIQYLSIFHLLTGSSDVTRYFHYCGGSRAGRLTMTHGKSMQNFSRTASTFATFENGMHNCRMANEELYCNVKYSSGIISLNNWDRINVWFTHSLSAGRSLPNDNIYTKFTCTQFICWLQKDQDRKRSQRQQSKTMEVDAFRYNSSSSSTSSKSKKSVL